MLPTNDLVRRVSSALSSLPEDERRRFRHEVLLDLDHLSIAWDFLLGVIEAASSNRVDDAVGEALRHLARFHGFNPAVGAQESASRLKAWAAGNGRSPFVTSLRSTVAALPGTFSGDPTSDIERVVTLLAGVRGEYARGCVELLQLRMPGALEPHIRRTLRDTYAESNAYEGALAIGHEHLVRERLYDSGMSRRSLSLMTLHKCKGKEFDAVILGESAQSPGRFLNSNEARSRNWPKSRRLLHVAITRARHRAILLTPAYDVSPLLQPFLS
jgi:DNA helicase-2/ATP-dependent DNA helicase PcrA